MAFPLVAAVCTKSEVIVSGVDFSDSQGDKEVVDVLIRMGADIEKDVEGNRLVVHGGKPLHGIRIDMNLIPDSLPALSVAAAYAQGDTVFTDLATCESRRPTGSPSCRSCLPPAAPEVDITSDTMAVHGGRPLTGMSVPSYGDHRVAMAMAVCGLLSDGEMRIQDAECADVSFPNFYKIMNRVGAGFELKEE
ncbi:MAG: 3-phosphoshikimate 1-carboxyvinyltransferase [Lawsonibacter sp.]